MSIDFVQAECLPTPCYIEQIHLTSCQPVSQVVPDAGQLRSSGLEPAQARELLEQASGVIITGNVDRSRPVSECAAPAARQSADAPRKLLVLEATCDELSAGHLKEGFVSTPCCDTLPVRSPECMLELETLGPIPAWATPD